MATAKTSTLSESRVSRAEAVARELEREILEESYSPGERLGTKEDLRHRFGVAVGTVNEAVRILELRGLVQARPGPGGGIFVSRPSTRIRLNNIVLGFGLDDAPFSDLLAVRNALEVVVCREAARYGTATAIRGLQSTINQMAEKQDSPREYLELNWQLHRKIAKMCRNAPLKSLYLMLLDFVEGSIQEVEPRGVFTFQENFEIHRELVDAIAAGDAARLEAAIASHTPVSEALSDGAPRKRRRRAAS